MEVTGKLLQTGQHTLRLHQPRTNPAGPVLIRLQTLQLFLALLRGHLPGCWIRQGKGFIEQTVRQRLPEGFQRSEFLLEHGALDMIVERKDMRDTLHRLMGKLTPADHTATKQLAAG